MLLYLLSSAPLADADLYRWRDDEGVTHYTGNLDRVPRRYRDAVELVRPQSAPARGGVPELEVARPPQPLPQDVTEPTSAETAPDGPLATTPDPIVRPVEEPRAPEPLVSLPPDAPAPVGAAPVDADPRDAEIAELEREIASKREQVKELISTDQFDGSSFALDPQLRNLSRELPRLQAELDALRGELEP